MVRNHAQTAPLLPRVCLLTEGFFPPAVGGQQKQAHDLAALLISRGTPLFVVTRQTDPPSPLWEYADGIEIIRVPPGGLLTGKGWRALGPLMLFLLRVFVLLIRLRNRYDIVMALGLKTLPLPAMLAVRLLRKRCVIKCESPIEVWQDISAMSLRAMGVSDKSPLLAYARTVRYHLIGAADRVVAISRQIHQQLMDVGVNPAHIECIPNGVDVDQFVPVSVEQKLSLREALHLPSDKTLIVFTGRLALSKGIMPLIQVWEALSRTHDDIHLVIVGSGAGCFDNCEPELKAYIQEHHLANGVTLTGAVDNVHQYLQASDIFVFPSKYEGFGLSIAEAMSCGLPSVVSNVGIAVDLIQNYKTAVLFEPGVDTQLLAGMEWVLDHRDVWQDMGTLARDEIVTRYGMDAVAAAYMAMFSAISPYCAAGTNYSVGANRG